MLTDYSERFVDTWNFLDRRIEDALLAGSTLQQSGDVNDAVNAGVASILSAAGTLLRAAAGRRGEGEASGGKDRGGPSSSGPGPGLPLPSSFLASPAAAARLVGDAAKAVGSVAGGQQGAVAVARSALPLSLACQPSSVFTLLLSCLPSASFFVALAHNPAQCNSGRGSCRVSSGWKCNQRICEGEPRQG